MKDKGTYLFILWFKHSRYFSFIFIRFIPLYPCLHPCPCPCFGSLHNQMFWTHDFDHMSLIYDIVNTFLSCTQRRITNHHSLPTISLIWVLLCAAFVTVGYYLFVRVWSSLRIDIVFFQWGVLYISHSDTIPNPWNILFTNTRQFCGVGSPSPPTQQIESRQNKKRCASLRTSQTCIPKKPEPSK